MKIFYFLFPIAFAFNFKKFICTSLLGSTLLLNPTVSLAYNHPPILNQVESEITTLSSERNNIYFYGPFTPESCRQLKTKIYELNENAKLFKSTYNYDPPPIHLHIQSSGGSLMNSLFIVDVIQSIETPVYTYVDGYAASAASLISVVGKKRFISKNSLVMIHQLSSEKMGKYQELDDDMKNLQLLMNKIKSVYVTNTKIPYLQLNDVLQHDLWLDAETCKKYGIIDEII
tara:strand:+ start:1213 stop:1902 length:690 start_codon:yes stop_codon:yes gene_type:complete